MVPSSRVIRLDGNQPRVDRKVWHFTQLESFEKIVSSGKLLLSSTSRCNDKEEHYYALDLLLDVCLRNMNDALGRLFRNFLLEQLFPGPKTGLAISCLTISPFPLSMWRAYAPNDGICFAVPLSHMEEIPAQSVIRATPVIYEPLLQQDRVLPAITRWSEKYFQGGMMERRGIFSDDRCFEYYCNLMRQEFLPIIAQLKHPAFEEEQEFRIFAVEADKEECETIIVEGEARIAIPLPQIDGQLYIPEIWVGPCEDYSKKLSEVESMLKSSSCRYDAINYCNIPLEFHSAT